MALPPIPGSGLGAGPAFGQNGMLLYDVAGVENAIGQLQAVATQTETNWQTSINLLNQSKANWSGSGYDSFEQVYARLNMNYENSTQTINQARTALDHALYNILTTDAQRAAQYLL
jgi:uncharacterized protein YukE